MITSTTSLTLPVMEQFYTIQGEGFYQGKAAYFVRLGGCDVGCTWCDVKESWDADAHPKKTLEDIISAISETAATMVVVTGGEPLLHQLDEFTAALKNAGLQTNIETSGSSPMSGHWDWVCLSPKKFKFPLPEANAAADELKVIIYNNDDFKWAEKHAALVGPTCKLYLQPEWSRVDKMVPLIVDYVMANPKWEISMQLHKYMGVE